jgi:hypothetical protein
MLAAILAADIAGYSPLMGADDVHQILDGTKPVTSRFINRLNSRS